MIDTSTASEAYNQLTNRAMSLLAYSEVGHVIIVHVIDHINQRQIDILYRNRT